jgi:myo-inositol 2-dehydrogenase/D-chiro-inositol 1-dehydrogenase
MFQRIRVGVVGAGAVASSVHLPILSRRSDLFELKAITDLNIKAAEALAKRFAIPLTFNSATEMFQSKEIDAVFILNSGSHAELVATALAADLDVFCEKPLAYTHSELALIDKAKSSSGKKLMIGYMKTFDQALYRAKERISGRPRTVDVVVLHPSGGSQLATTDVHLESFPLPAELVPSIVDSDKRVISTALGDEAAEAFGREYMDILMGSVIHELSVLRALDLHLTDIDYVDRWPIERKSESFIIAGRTTDGVRVTIRWFYLDSYPKYQEEIRWVNENEGHQIVFSSPYILRVPTEYTHTARNGLDHIEHTFKSYQSNFEIEIAAFANLVNTGAEQEEAIAAALEDLVIIQKIAKEICRKEGLTLGGDLASN